MKRQSECRITFITGTDTNVGKTVFTGHALHYLRSAGGRALAMKPFCSGGRGDAEFLSCAQADEISLDLVNPFYFAPAIAPLLAARQEGRCVSLARTVASITVVARHCDHLLVEGAGGLLAPLGEGFTLLPLIRHFRGEAVVVAANRLGVINHVRLTLAALPARLRREPRVVLMQPPERDASAQGNARLLRELVPGMRLFTFPWLGAAPCTIGALEKNCKNLSKGLAGVI